MTSITIGVKMAAVEVVKRCRFSLYPLCLSVLPSITIGIKSGWGGEGFGGEY